MKVNTKAMIDPTASPGPAEASENAPMKSLLRKGFHADKITGLFFSHLDISIARLRTGWTDAERHEMLMIGYKLGSSRGMEALLDATEEAIAEKVEQLLAGHVEADPIDAARQGMNIFFRDIVLILK